LREEVARDKTLPCCRPSQCTWSAAKPPGSISLKFSPSSALGQHPVMAGLSYRVGHTLGLIIYPFARVRCVFTWCRGTSIRSSKPPKDRGQTSEYDISFSSPVAPEPPFLKKPRRRFHGRDESSTPHWTKKAMSPAWFSQTSIAKTRRYDRRIV
jgi:hypothetical protein